MTEPITDPIAIALREDLGDGDTTTQFFVREDLRARFDYEEARIQTLPMKFACPSLVLRDGSTNSGASESFQPWSDAVAEG